MDRSTQVDRAAAFRKMHDGPRLLLLPNAWDVVSAKLYEVEGFRAIGTTSAGIASALGFPDGERMTLEDNLAVCRRIVEHVAVPVSVDIEAPLNLIAGAKTPSVQRLEALGVARLSFGPRPMRAALQFLRTMAREWLGTGTYAGLTSGESLSYDEVNAWFAR